MLNTSLRTNKDGSTQSLALLVVGRETGEEFKTVDNCFKRTKSTKQGAREGLSSPTMSDYAT